MHAPAYPLVPGRSCLIKHNQEPEGHQVFGTKELATNRHWPVEAQRSMKMPHVIPDSIRNPARHSGVGRNKDWIAAYAAMTIYFHIKVSGKKSFYILRLD